jgi:hypothetical protein
VRVVGYARRTGLFRKRLRGEFTSKGSFSTVDTKLKLRELLPEIHRNGPFDERAKVAVLACNRNHRRAAIETIAEFALRGTLIDGRLVF